MRQIKKLHYGWAVCAGCALLLFCTSGLAVNAFTIYQPYILTQNGFTNAQSSLIVTVRSLFGFAAMLLTGVYYRELSLRAGMGLAGCLIAAGFFIFSAAKSYAAYLLGAAAVGLGYGFGTMIPVSIVMERWFIEKRTMAVGLCSAVTGLSTLGIPSLLTWMIERYGLAASFRIEGAAIAVLILMSFLLIRSRPQDVGMQPYGSWDRVEHRGFENHGRSLTRKNWLLLIPMLLCAGAFTSVGYSHITVLAQGEGVPAHTIALAVTISGVTLMVSKFVYGLIEEKLSAYRTNRIFGALLTAGLVLCCVFDGRPALLYLAMIVYGLGLPLGTVALTAWAGDLSSPEKYDETIRRFQVGYSAGGLVFSTLPGVLADRFGGSYVPAYIFFTACAVFTVFAIQRTYRRAGRK